MADGAERPAMSRTTYTLVVREGAGNEGIIGEVRADGTIEESTRLSYGDFGLTAIRDDWLPNERRTEVEADVRTVRLQTERNGEGFSFRVLGDGETIAEQRISDDEWRVAAVR
ncbi:hypothetical protein BG842_15955 [Haladaptatus sp. W1]|nr:hypothetical protein BG842_15955 [Haladaptatus sp. W1]